MYEDLKRRTRAFALRIIRLYGLLPKTVEAQVIGKQMLRSGPSVGAHYREACRGRSTADFVSKVEAGLQELEETMYWLELLLEAEIGPSQNIREAHAEADELMAILTTCAKNAKARGTS